MYSKDTKKKGSSVNKNYVNVKIKNKQYKKRPPICNSDLKKSN